MWGGGGEEIGVMLALAGYTSATGHFDRSGTHRQWLHDVEISGRHVVMLLEMVKSARECGVMFVFINYWPSAHYVFHLTAVDQRLLARSVLAERCADGQFFLWMNSSIPVSITKRS